MSLSRAHIICHRCYDLTTHKYGNEAALKNEEPVNQTRYIENKLLSDVEIFALRIEAVRALEDVQREALELILKRYYMLESTNGPLAKMAMRACAHCTHLSPSIANIIDGSKEYQKKTSKKI